MSGKKMGAAGEDNAAFQIEIGDDLKKSSTKSAGGCTVSSTQRAMTKDVCFVSLGFLCLFTSFQSLANLQSSINPGVGTASQSVLYATMVISSLFIPTWLLNKVGVKRSLALCTIGYTVYSAAQAYPTYYTLVPAAFILGLGASPLWTAKCTYLGFIGSEYAKAGGLDTQVVITRFFGIFFFFFQSSQVFGNVISSVVLGSNEIVNSSDPRLDHCGMNFCHGFSASEGSGESSDPISSTERYILTAVFVFFSLASPVVIMLFVSPLSKYGGDNRIGSSTGRSTLQQVNATFRHLKNPYQILIAPLTVYSGLEQGFIFADYTAAYVSCGLGIHMVGYATISFGVSNAICSYFCSSVVKKTGRIPIFCFSMALNAATIAAMSFWKPTPDQIAVFFVIPAVWGVSDAIWQTQTNAFYGVLFPTETEAAFSNYKLWESAGFIIAYICSTLVCIPVKIYTLIAFLVIGMTGYGIIELLESRKNNRCR